MTNISSRTEYGIRALLEIASGATTGALASAPVKRSDISERQAIPLPFLTQILQALINKGLIASTRGRFGGYTLARAAQKITVLEVIDALQGPQVPRPCVDSSQELRCELASSCRLVPMWAELKRASESVLASYTIADLLQKRLAPSLKSSDDLYSNTLKG